ncbi:hypothetical protein QYH69_32535 [Paraburkholderia sp. SARCC-3016]|uniref:hypothetical protein n=1 Tax=Paraburkholderia sp. SARCC-3016 TaxID=3058611 RepID=UPI00280A151B|nr:hypothetical protein [Paraburkholderia sp. SARCC-3016]MDQ7981953.1 hypothetical protein [Paraburkholderia sp. SARCC-3016]
MLFGLVFTGPRQVAVAATSSPPSMAAVIGALVGARALDNGFTPFDPRVAETVTAIGAAASSIAAGIAASAGEALGSVSWLAVGVGAGLGAALGGVPVTLGNDTLTQWQLNHDGTVTLTSNAASGGSLPVFSPLVAGAATWCVSGVFCGSSALAAAWANAQHFNAAHSDEGISDISCSAASSTVDNCVNTLSVAGSSSGTAQPSFQVGISGTSAVACASGMESAGACIALQALFGSAASSPPAPVTESLAAAIAGTSAADDGDVMNAQLLAALVNSLWGTAAQGEGYAGLPFPVNAPVLPSDVQSIEGNFGSLAPTVGSAISGAGSLSGASSSAPFAIAPSTTSGAGSSSSASSVSVPVATDPGSGAQVNLGPDPGIGSPSLEETPTAQQILAPILGLLPDLRNYVLPAHTAQCPQPSITLFGSTVTLTAQCTLAEQFRSQIQVTFALVFTLVSLFIVLTA